MKINNKKNFKIIRLIYLENKFYTEKYLKFYKLNFKNKKFGKKLIIGILNLKKNIKFDL